MSLLIETRLKDTSTRHLASTINFIDDAESDTDSLAYHPTKIKWLDIIFHIYPCHGVNVRRIYSTYLPIYQPGKSCCGPVGSSSPPVWRLSRHTYPYSVVLYVWNRRQGRSLSKSSRVDSEKKSHHKFTISRKPPPWAINFYLIGHASSGTHVRHIPSTHAVLMNQKLEIHTKYIAQTPPHGPSFSLDSGAPTILLHILAMHDARP